MIYYFFWLLYAIYSDDKLLHRFNSFATDNELNEYYSCYYYTYVTKSFIVTLMLPSLLLLQMVIIIIPSQQKS